MKNSSFNSLDKQGKRKKQFFLHMGLVGASTIIMFLFNMMTEPNNLWTLKISLIWMLILGIHYFIVFGILSSKKKQNHYHQDDVEEAEKLKLKELRKNYRDSDLV